MTERPSVVRFVVLSMPRTGSSMLTERLSTHDSVRCLPAIFSSTGWYSSKSKSAGGLLRWIVENMDPDWENEARRTALPRKLLSEIVTKSADKRAVGFKHHLTGTEKITDILLSSRFRKIILTRNNFLAAYSSQKIVELTGQGAARARFETHVVRAQAVFDQKEFLKFCNDRNKRYAHANASANGPKLEIDYVDVRTDRGMASIARFLRIDPTGFGPPLTAKRNSDDILSRFENPDDVQCYLRENSLEHWTSEA